MATRVNRVFVDTNVWASLLWNPESATATAVALLRASHAPLLVSLTVVRELDRFVARDRTGGL